MKEHSRERDKLKIKRNNTEKNKNERNKMLDEGRISKSGVKDEEKTKIEKK